MSSSGPSSPYYGGFLLNSTTRMYNDRFVFHSQPSNKSATILMDFIEVLFEVIYAAKPNTSWETFVSALLNNMGETCQLFFFSGSGLERLAEMLLPMNRDLGSYL